MDPQAARGGEGEAAVDNCPARCFSDLAFGNSSESAAVIHLNVLWLAYFAVCTTPSLRLHLQLSTCRLLSLISHSLSASSSFWFCVYTHTQAHADVSLCDVRVNVYVRVHAHVYLNVVHSEFWMSALGSRA